MLRCEYTQFYKGHGGRGGSQSSHRGRPPGHPLEPPLILSILCGHRRCLCYFSMTRTRNFR